MKNKRTLLFLSLLGISLFSASLFYLHSYTAEAPINTFQIAPSQSVLSESTEIQTISETPTPAEIPTSKINSPKPSPTSTIITSQPTNDEPSKSSITEAPTTITTNNETSINTSSQDPYKDFLDQQLEEMLKKQEYCNKLYIEVKASIQPLFNSRDTISQQYSDAIESGNVDKIGYYQQELSMVQSQIDAAFYQEYYSVCS